MNSEELRKRQGPIKQLYRENAAAALVTLKAIARLGREITCKIESGKPGADAGLHPAAGGDGSHACSGDMLLEALAACAGVTLKAVATSMAIDLKKGSVIAEGDIDFRGTLGVSRDVPVGFRQIRLSFELDTSASEDQLATLIRLTERYCVVFQTLKSSPEIILSSKRIV